MLDTLGTTKILTLADGGGFADIDRACGDGHEIWSLILLPLNEHILTLERVCHFLSLFFL